MTPYQARKHALAQAHGYGSVDALIRTEYPRKSLADVGKMYGVSFETVRHRVMALGIYVPNRCKTLYRWDYFKDKLAVAQSLGYKHPDELVIAEYAKLQSMRLTAAILGMTGCALKSHLVRLGVRIRPRGGDTRRIV